MCQPAIALWRLAALVRGRLAGFSLAGSSDSSCSSAATWSSSRCARPRGGRPSRRSDQEVANSVPNTQPPNFALRISGLQLYPDSLSNSLGYPVTAMCVGMSPRTRADSRLDPRIRRHAAAAHHIERARMSSPLAAVRLSIASDGSSSTVDPSVDTSSPLRRHLSWMVSA